MRRDEPDEDFSVRWKGHVYCVREYAPNLLCTATKSV